TPYRGVQEWSRRAAAVPGLPYRHITAEEMDRPENLHAATAVYYDGTGVFNRIPSMPHGFVVSRKHFSTAQEDLELCLKIALGPHGFGDLFTARNPFSVIPIAHPTDFSLSLKALEREVREVTAPYGRRVKVSGVKTGWHMRDLVCPFEFLSRNRAAFFMKT